MKHWRIGTRLGLGFAFVVLVLVACSLVAVKSLREASASFQEADHRQESSQLLAEWVAHSRVNVERVIALAASGNSSAMQAHFNAPMQATSARIAELQKELDSRMPSGRGHELLAEVRALRTSYVDARSQLFEKLKSGADAEAELQARLLPAARAYLDKMGELQKHQDSVDDQFLNQVVERSRTETIELAVLALIGTLAGIVAAVTLTRSVTTPLRRAVSTASRVAAGDLRPADAAVPIGHDELGELQLSLSQMRTTLAGLVGDIRSSSDGIATAAREISAGSQDLSTRTESSASNLEETASSIEEIAATVQHSADSAHQASSLAGLAAAAAQRGGDEVRHVVTTMDAIKDASTQMSEIIAVIDGIAFQTNILALNASVESARAGEHGKGFAVVASEVRALAQRSAHAAKDIRGLISQNAGRVEEGSAAARSAGGTMVEAVEQAARLTEVIQSISTSASEQRDGIAQINVAVNGLDQATQQNAALVEQSAAAAHSLQEQTQHLTQLVSRFTL